MANGKKYLIVGWITLFLMGIDLFVVSPLLPIIAKEYEVSSSAAGWMVSVFAVTYAISAPFFGWLSDKRGRRGPITFGLLFFSVSNILTALAPTFLFLIFSRVFAGLSVASITPLIHATIGDIAPDNKRGTWLSITVSGHLTALWTGAPFGAILEHFLGWRSVFIVMACTGLFLATINFKTWSRIKRIQTSLKSQSKVHLSKIILSVSITSLWAISMYSLYIYLGAALYSLSSFSVYNLAIAITIYGIGAVFGSLTSGQMTDRFGEKRISILTLLLLGIILTVMGFLFTSNWWIYPLLFLWAMVGYAGFASYQAYLSSKFPSVRGVVMAWNNTALYSGITLGSLIGGFIISEWGFIILPYVSGGIALLGFLLIFKIK